MRALTEFEFNEWKMHPGTQALMAILEARRDTMRRQWEGGSFTDYDTGTTALINVGNLGTCKGYAFVAELTYEEYLTEIDDGESERIGPEGGSSTDQIV